MYFVCFCFGRGVSMADVDWTEVTSSLEKTEVVLKGLSADVQPSTDPDEAATHIVSGNSRL